MRWSSWFLVHLQKLLRNTNIVFFKKTVLGRNVNFHMVTLTWKLMEWLQECLGISAFSAQELWLPEVQLVTGWMLQCYPGCCYQWSHSQKVIICHSWTAGHSIIVLVFRSCTFRIKSLRYCLKYSVHCFRSWIFLGGGGELWTYLHRKSQTVNHCIWDKF